MIGVLVVTHYDLGKNLIKTAKSITGKNLEAFEHISINPVEDVNSIRDKIESAIKSLENTRGIIILTDMYGGTPSSISCSFLKKNEIEILSGVNLPILMKTISIREDKDKSIEEIVKTIENFGRQSISMVSSILAGKTRQIK